MRKILLLVLLFVASHAAAQFRITDCTGGSAYVVPKVIVAGSGETVEVEVRTCWGPGGLPYDIAVLPSHVAEGTARIYPGFDSVRLLVSTKRPGVATISYTLPQFGRAPSTRFIGRIYVVGQPRRRSARH